MAEAVEKSIHQLSDVDDPRPDRKKAAIWYAKCGLYVVPCHTPLSKAVDSNGEPTICTCEEFWRYKGTTKKPANPNYICSSAGKHPREKEWEKRASNDPEHIKRLWDRWPTANIGIAAGKSDLVVIDVDTYNEIAEGGKLELSDRKTVTSLTGGGGEHLVYRHPPDGPPINNSDGNLPDWVNVRAHGGQFLVPPSAHISGDHYQWEPGYGPHEMDPLPLPQVLIQLLQGTASRKQSAPPVEGDIPAGKRHPTLVSFAGTMRRRGMSKEGMIAALLAENERCKPPKPEWEIRDIAKWAAGLTPEDPVLLSLSGNGAKNIDIYKGESEDVENYAASYLLTESADHEGHAQCLHRLYEDKLLFCPELGWLYKTKTHWAVDPGEARTQRAAVETLIRRRGAAILADNEAVVKTTRATRQNVNGTIALFRSLVTISISEFDNNPDLLNCSNGVLHLPTRRLVTSEPGQRFTYCLNVPYNEDAVGTDADRAWRGFIGEVTGGKIDLDNYLQMAVGYSFTGRIREECLFYLFGPTRAGKGTLGETLLTALGRPLATSLEFQSLTAPRYGDVQNFDLAGLRPARFVVASESNKYQPLNPSKIKQVTGGDHIRAAFKHRDIFTFRPRFKLWLLSNHPVNIDVDDDAAWSRVRVINFPNSYLGKEDKNLKARFRQTESLQAVLAWAAEGARLWYQSERGLVAPKSVIESTNYQRESQDFVAIFIEERCTLGNDYWVSSGNLYTDYSAWCNENGVTPKKLRQFSMALRAKGFEQRRGKRHGKRLRGFSGLRLRRLSLD